MTSSLVGSEMCIRDSVTSSHTMRPHFKAKTSRTASIEEGGQPRGSLRTVSYTHLTLPTICSV
eukprot:1654474-Prorocentrum_lima.AAC.1